MSSPSLDPLDSDESSDRSNQNAEYEQTTKPRFKPDLTIPCSLLGLAVGFFLVIFYSPNHPKEILISSVSIGWLIGFLYTIGIIGSDIYS